jgi:type IV pilus assembly protein PilN
MREIKTSDLFGEPALQIIQTKDVNKVQARVFELTIPLKLEADQEGAGGKR